MLTINDHGKRLPYTYKEIVEIDYPDFWNAANESIRRAYAVQEMMLEMLPVFHDHLSGDTEKWQSEKAINTLVNYLKLRSLYGFGHYIWEEANQWCHELGKSGNDVDYDGIEKAKTDLIALFETINKVDVIDIVQDMDTGFQKLEKALGSTDFHVMKGLNSEGLLSSWSFRDILGTLEGVGPTDNLWAVALNSAFPTEPNIGGLMESEEDNKLVRLY